MLALDQRARRWCNERLYKALLNTFNWPKSSPTKVISSITDIQSAEDILARQLCKGLTNEEFDLRTVYLVIDKTFKAGSLNRLLETVTPEEARNLVGSSGWGLAATTSTATKDEPTGPPANPTFRRSRFYIDPRVSIHLSTTYKGPPTNGTFWLITNKLCKDHLVTTVLAPSIGGVYTPLRIDNLFHRLQPNAVNNGMAALWHIACYGQGSPRAPKTVLVSAAQMQPLISHLENPCNTDWRCKAPKPIFKLLKYFYSLFSG